MPMTYAEHDKKMKVPAVCELLPLRDLPQGDNVRSQYTRHYAQYGVNC